MNNRDKEAYRNKGLKSTTIKTVYGEVTYQRRIYEVTREDGIKEFVFLLDEQEVSFVYNGPEKSAEEVISGREGARLGEAEGRPSVLKILADKEEPPKDTHRPIKLSWGSPKKEAGAER